MLQNNDERNQTSPKLVKIWGTSLFFSWKLVPPLGRFLSGCSPLHGAGKLIIFLSWILTPYFSSADFWFFVHFLHFCWDQTTHPPPLDNGKRLLPWYCSEFFGLRGAANNDCRFSANQYRAGDALMVLQGAHPPFLNSLPVYSQRHAHWPLNAQFFF